MPHPFEIEVETSLAATPDQVWEAIATGPGVDSWFMGRNEIEPREGGIAAMDTGGQREEAVITAYEPGKRLATRTATNEQGRFMAFEYLIEGREGGSTVLRVVHSGMLGDDWQDEYDALRRGWPFHLHTLGEYLTHFAGRTGTPVFAVAFGQSAPEVWAAITGALSLTAPVVRGARAHAEPAELPPLEGEVVWADDERLAVRTADGLYTFHHGPTGMAIMFHHLFGPNTVGAESAWQRWLSALVA
ncbi:SRPBCC domain-containing protein [Nocardia sp. SYP-A9097]|uniref:SRPBCC family protein n=1 Tax=Nocardia sp. SYP-A9097 TaxID=2663237 RepID=UPI00129B6DB4|nr:SRPBCC domain-containing protein [Nocardia sp. SYP-A9097]MRH88032.1 SRPBCC domain-containing protein [Nocardia sp. SYP-A9097]